MLIYTGDKKQVEFIDIHGNINKENVKTEFENLVDIYNLDLKFEEIFDRLKFNWSKEIQQDDWSDYIRDYGEYWTTNEQYQNNEMFFFDGEVWCSLSTLDDWFCSSDTTYDDKIIYSIAYDIIAQFHKLHNIEAV